MDLANSITKLKRLQYEAHLLEHQIVKEMIKSGETILELAGYKVSLLQKKRSDSAAQAVLKDQIEAEQIRRMRENALEVYQQQNIIVKAEARLNKIIQLENPITQVSSSGGDVLDIKVDVKSDAVYLFVSKEEFKEFKKKSGLSKAAAIEYILNNQGV
jgi:hypothetical protein